MCGIAGILSKNKDLLERIQWMSDAQAHRGPDGVGYAVFGKRARGLHNTVPSVEEGDFLAFGHRRLAILDTTSAGIQPMSSPGGDVWICFNGEIYNYVELRNELIELGFSFSTATDTEVALMAYKAWGVECFNKFNGMWALALWDDKKKKIILSRDRLGVKPLYYASANESLIFASEIKAILSTGLVDKKINMPVAIDYLKWAIVDHSNDTFFDGVYAFPAGHYAVIDESGVIRPVSFWSLETQSELNKFDLDEAIHRFRNLFMDSVRLRLRSDVPVGACLSGGLDSSAIVCQANQLRGSQTEKLHTFNAASKDPRYDERSWCDVVNKDIDANAHYVFPNSEEFQDELDRLIWHQEEPFTSASIYAQWTLMKEARNSHIPVLLDGQGADEILCGYRKYYIFYLQEIIKKKNLLSFAREFISLLRFGDRGIFRLHEGKRYLPKFFRRDHLMKSLTDKGKTLWSRSSINISSAGSISDRQILDIRKYSVPSLLRYEDRNSMAWSIETRVPFLDYRLVEWLVNISTNIKLSGGRTKYLLRTAMRGIVPDAILDRRDKMGFVTEQEQWMRDNLFTTIEKCFMDKDFPLSSILDKNALVEMLTDWKNNKPGIAYSDIFRIFVLARWMRRFDVEAC